MGRTYQDTDVFSAAIERLTWAYENDHRVVCSFSAGKDSGIVLELAKLAAAEADRLPVEVVMRDEEIMFPGTYEYAERVARDPLVDFHWVYARQPIVNAFNRVRPYWWVFDPELDPSEWVREPPTDLPRPAYEIADKNIVALINTTKFPAPPGKDLIVLMGLRAAESPARMYGIYSSRGWLTKPQPQGGYKKGRPIYDWTDGDVWREIRDGGWDYNRAYDVMHRFGVNRRELRIAPPMMRAASIPTLEVASRAWPRWFDRVARRCPGLREAARFGRRAVEPARRLGETWEDTFRRTVLDNSPDWIKQRATVAMNTTLKRHAAHSSDALPQVARCPRCVSLGSWQLMVQALYMGDPFSFNSDQPYVEPEFFREGAGRWGGAPTW